LIIKAALLVVVGTLVHKILHRQRRQFFNTQTSQAWNLHSRLTKKQGTCHNSQIH